MGVFLKLLLLALVVFRVVPAILRLFMGRDRGAPAPQPPARQETERSTLGGSEIVEAEFEDLPGGRS